MIKVLINERYCKCSIGILCEGYGATIIWGALLPIILLSLLMNTRNINYEKDITLRFNTLKVNFLLQKKLFYAKVYKKVS